LDTITSDRAVVITIGNEILSGKTVNTNASYISKKLGETGIKTVRSISVGDERLDIQWAVKEACSSADIIICTGGLGPTWDDISKRTVSEYFGRSIKLDREQLRIVEEKFRALGYEKMPENNITQAEIPEGAVVFPNSRGTAPGLLIIDGSTHFFMLPGVPSEMKGLMPEQIIPYLQKTLQKQEIFLFRTIRTTGINESLLAELLHPVLGNLDDPEVAFLPNPYGVDVGLTTKGKNNEEILQKVRRIEEDILKIVSKYIYGYDDDTMESIVGFLLKKLDLSLSTAESCTGGLIGDRITAVPGSSEYFDRGVITYSNQSKIDLLDVDPSTLEEKGAVSEEIARQMAEGIRKKSGCDISIATTGIAGPSGGSPEKPVGLVYIALADKFGTVVHKLHFRGERTRIKQQTTQAALNLIRLRLNDKNLYSD